MQSKLTLRLEEGLIRQAKAIARTQGKSVSQMVSEYFALLAGRSSSRSEPFTPKVRSLRGVLKRCKMDREDYRRHLEDKYL